MFPWTLSVYLVIESTKKAHITKSEVSDLAIIRTLDYFS